MALVTRQQLRSARAWLGWEQRELAAAASVSTGTIRAMEKGDGPLPGRHDTVQRLQHAFEKAGLEFLNHRQPGVRAREQNGVPA